MRLVDAVSCELLSCDLVKASVWGAVLDTLQQDIKAASHNRWSVRFEIRRLVTELCLFTVSCAIGQGI